MEPRSIRILAVDDHPLLREGLAALFVDQTDMKLIAQACNGNEAIRQFRLHHPDVTLMDLRLPDMSGIDAIVAILKDCPQAGIIVLTTYPGDVLAQRALRAGARGYILKDLAHKELLDAIRAVNAGKKRIHSEVASRVAQHLGQEDLTPRELDVLELIRGGNKNKQIAGQLYIAETTVNFHIRNIVGKLQAKDRTHAVAIALERGVLQI